jgi:predicted lipid carrier protein YhbT
VASVQDCERALRSLLDRYAAVDADTRTRHAVDRTISWHVTDLDVVFRVRVADGVMGELQHAAAVSGVDGAQVRLAAASDDLVALACGALSPPAAWASGRLRVEASVLDLLRLRSWL